MFKWGLERQLHASSGCSASCMGFSCGRARCCCCTAEQPSYVGLSAGCLLQVFEDPNKRRNMLVIIGITLGLFSLYLLVQRARKH